MSDPLHRRILARRAIFIAASMGSAAALDACSQAQVCLFPTGGLDAATLDDGGSVPTLNDGAAPLVDATNDASDSFEGGGDAAKE